MPYLVRFRGGVNATMKAREDVAVSSSADFHGIIVTLINNPGSLIDHEDGCSGVSLVRVCETCGHEELLAEVRTSRMAGL